MKKSSTKKKTKKQRIATISVGPKKPTGIAKAPAGDPINVALTRDLIVGPPLKFSKKPSFSAKSVGEHIQVEVPVVSEDPWDVSLDRDLIVSKPLKLKIKTRSRVISRNQVTSGEVSAYFQDWLDTAFSNGQINRNVRQIMLNGMREVLPELVDSLARSGNAIIKQFVYGESFFLDPTIRRI